MKVQKDEQGSLRLVDILLFPAGTIVSSGPNCSEQGSGRWLPKPSDTLSKFILLSKPSVGFKNIPLLWFEMMDVSKILVLFYLTGLQILFQVNILFIMNLVLLSLTLRVKF